MSQSQTDLFLRTYKTTAAEIIQNIGQATDLLMPPFPTRDPLKQEAVRFVAHGGKRFRPALSLIVARRLGHSDVFPHLALETFHKFLLVHDDIIDRDFMRYGAPTTHAKMSQLLGKKDQHFGNSLAIISGDLTSAATTKIILKSNLSDAKKIALQQLVVEALDEVAWGWYDQFLMDYLPLDSPALNFKRIEKSMIWVTGRYSLKLPILFGYTVAGKRPSAGLVELADTIGALFQTGDDLIGLFGNVKDTGKSNYGDIAQGKKTIPMWYAYQGATSAQKTVLSRLVGKADITKAEVAEVRAIITQSGALERTKQCMQDYRNSCLRQLEGITLKPELKDFFAGFVHYLEARDR